MWWSVCIFWWWVLMCGKLFILFVFWIVLSLGVGIWVCFLLMFCIFFGGFCGLCCGRNCCREFGGFCLFCVYSWWWGDDDDLWFWWFDFVYFWYGVLNGFEWSFCDIRLERSCDFFMSCICLIVLDGCCVGCGIWFFFGLFGFVCFLVCKRWCWGWVW